MRNAKWAWVVPAVICCAPSHAIDYLSAEQAWKVLFPRATSAVDMPIDLSEADRKRIEERSGLRQRWKRQPVWRLVHDQEALGWMIVDEVVGKHEYITYAAAIDTDGTVIGIEILSYRETYGFQVRNKAWRDVFKGKRLDDAFKLDVDIPNISGATLSCRNVSNGVKRLLAFHHLILAHPART